MAELLKKCLEATIKKSKADGVYTLWASTNRLDSQNDITEPTSFKNLGEFLGVHPTILYNHSWINWNASGEDTLPVGKAVDGRIVPETGLQLDIKFAELPLAEKIKYLVDNDFPMFASIGGYVRESLEENTPEGKLIRRIKNFELIETSITPVPANYGAQFIKQLKAAGRATTNIEEAIEAITKYDLRAMPGLSEKEKASMLADRYLR